MVANDTPTSGDGRGSPAVASAARATAIRVIHWLSLHALAAILSIAAGLAIAQLADEYGYHPNRNASTWAAQPARYAVSTACEACHAGPVAVVVGTAHEAVDCQACHGAAGEHARTGSPTVAGEAAASATPATCLVCHGAGLGRPVAFTVVAPDVHFGPAPCLACHDPHTTVAPSPPRVRHSLDRLPACAVCHGPYGLKPVPAGHPAWSGDCLVCHLRGGPTT